MKIKVVSGTRKNKLRKCNKCSLTKEETLRLISQNLYDIAVDAKEENIKRRVVKVLVMFDKIRDEL